MRLAFSVALGGPLWAAVVAAVVSERARATVVSAVLGCVAALAGIGVILAEVVREGEASARGFEADAWRAILAAGLLLVGAAATIGERSDARGVGSLMVAAGASVAALFASDAATAGAGLALAIGALGLASAMGGAPAVRSFRWVGLGGALALIGLGLAASGSGLGVPVVLRGAGAWPVAAGAILLAGVFPVIREAGERGADVAIRRGPVRALGFMLAAWIGIGGGAPASAMVAVALASAAWGAWEAARNRSFPGMSAAQAGLAIAALGAAGAATLRSALLLVAGSLLASALAHGGAGRFAGVAGGAVPIGASFAGAASFATALFARGIDARWWLLAAFAVTAIAGWMAIAGVAGSTDPSARAARRSALALAPLALLVVAVVIVPGSTADRLGDPVAGSLGIERPLGPIRGAPSDDLGIVFAAAAVGGLVVSRRPRAGMNAVHGEPFAAPPARAEVRQAALAGAAMLVSAIVLLGVAVERGFL